MKINTATKPVFTHEGGKAKRINDEQALRRSVMSCLLWEKEAYESGESIADRITSLASKVKPHVVANIAIEAREKFKLRHVPLLIVREMARLQSHKSLVAETLSRVIQRADELTEFCAIWQKGETRPLSKTLSKQAQKGLASAFRKFNEYGLAKYNRDGAIKLRDVLFLSHAKPQDPEQDALWKRLINNELVTPDTWEVEISASKDKKESWTRLLKDNKLGALALLRNLRNLDQAGVETSLVKESLRSMKTERVLPFRFIAAARHATQLEPELESAMFRCLEGSKVIKGKTVLLVDVSGSMSGALSSKSDLTRLEAAYGLAMLLREVCEDVVIYSFSESLQLIPARRGFALRDAIEKSQPHSGTPLGMAISSIYAPKSERQTIRQHAYFGGQLHYRDIQAASGYSGQSLTPDRLIVITDEQSCDKIPDPSHGRGYMINVASAKNGVGYGSWTHIDGFSEAVVSFIQELEESEEV
jgi:60 kDa SS-A/Ro ribonucleoprotein